MSKQRTIVKLLQDAPHRGEWYKGDRGHIDGYIKAANGQPCAVVIIRGQFILVPFGYFELAE